MAKPQIKHFPSIIHGSRSPLPDELRGARLRGFLDGEAHEGNWWAVIRRVNGELWEETGNPGRPYAPEDDFRYWARNLCHRLNDQVHYNGMWTVVIFPPARRWALVWKDWDGDIQVFGEEDSPLALISQVKLDRMVEHGDEMIKAWLEAQYLVAAKPEQQVKLAQGERSTTDVAPPELMVH